MRRLISGLLELLTFAIFATLERNFSHGKYDTGYVVVHVVSFFVAVMVCKLIEAGMRHIKAVRDSKSTFMSTIDFISFYIFAAVFFVAYKWMEYVYFGHLKLSLLLLYAVFASAQHMVMSRFYDKLTTGTDPRGNEAGNDFVQIFMSDDDDEEDDDDDEN